STADIRLIQSFKSHVANPLFHDTQVFARRYTFVDLLSEFFQQTFSELERTVDLSKASIVSGRPVKFVGAKPDERLAITRYESAFARVGIDRVHYVYEPVGAAYYYAQRLKTEATVLVADFGGGTSDFSVLHFKRRSDGTMSARSLGFAGVGIAGDALDYRIID